MPLEPFKSIQAGGQLSASELNRLGMETEAHDRVSVAGGGFEVSRNAGGFQFIVHQPVEFWAKITASGGGSPAPHSWTQQKIDTLGNFTDDTVGLSGTTAVLPAYATDGSAAAANTRVRMYLAREGDFFLFETPSMGGGAGSLTVREVDLTPAVAMVTTLSLDQADGFQVSTPAAGEARVDLLDASVAQRGIVSLTIQEMGRGDKYFIDKVAIGFTFNGPFGQPQLFAVTPLHVKGDVTVEGNIRLRNRGVGTDRIGWGADPQILQAYITVGAAPSIANMQAVIVPQEGGDSGGAWWLFEIANRMFFTLVSNFGQVSYAVFDGPGGFREGISGDNLTSVNVRGGIVVGTGVGGPGGILPVGSGGTGAGAFTNFGILFGNNVAPIQATSPGAARTFLAGNGVTSPAAFRTIETQDVPAPLMAIRRSWLGI